MEAMQSSTLDILQLLSTLNYTARVEFVAGASNRYYCTWIHMAVFFTALVLSLWGVVLAGWGKYASSFSFKYNTGRKQMSRGFSHGCMITCSTNVSIQDLGCRDHDQKIKILNSMFTDEFIQSVEGPHHVCGKNSGPSFSLSNTDFPYDEGKVGATENFSSTGRPSKTCVGKTKKKIMLAKTEVKQVASFESQYGWDKLHSLKLGLQWNKSSSSHKLGLKLVNFQENFEIKARLQSPNRDLGRLLISKLPEDFVKCTDIWWSRDLSSICKVDNTIRLWDIQAGKCFHNIHFNDATVFSSSNCFQKGSQVFQVRAIVRPEQKSLLCVWDHRNFGEPLSLSLGNELPIHSVKFNDKKVYVCDDLNERVFDLRMSGAPLVEESALVMGNS